MKQPKPVKAWALLNSGQWIVVHSCRLRRREVVAECNRGMAKWLTPIRVEISPVPARRRKKARRKA